MQLIRHTSTFTPQPCVVTIGFFDGVHIGHRFLIKQVREIATAKGLQAALLTFPIHPRKVMDAAHQPELLTSFDEKIALLEETGIDYCLLLDFTPELSHLTAEEFMRQVLKERFHVKCLIVGYDHRFGYHRNEGFEDYVRYGKSMDIEVIHASASNTHLITGEEKEQAVSSSLIRRLLHRGDITAANYCLSYPYSLQGTVVKGHQLGRKLGFPTANLYIKDPDKLIPADGVYAVWVIFKGKQYKGMLNIGKRPTMDNGNNRTIEVHILHFQKEIYGSTICLNFVERIRPEQKFNEINELSRQLQLDAQQVEEILVL